MHRSPPARGTPATGRAPVGRKTGKHEVIQPGHAGRAPGRTSAMPTIILTDAWAPLSDVAATLRAHAPRHFPAGGATRAQWVTDADFTGVRVDCGRCFHYAQRVEVE